MNEMGYLLCSVVLYIASCAMCFCVLSLRGFGDKEALRYAAVFSLLGVIGLLLAFLWPAPQRHVRRQRRPQTEAEIEAWYNRQLARLNMRKRQMLNGLEIMQGLDKLIMTGHSSSGGRTDNDD